MPSCISTFSFRTAFVLMACGLWLGHGVAELEAASKNDTEWTLVHLIESVGNITQTYPSDRPANVLHCNYGETVQTAKFKIDVATAHQEWQRYCNATESFVNKDFPVDAPKTLWFCEPSTAGTFKPQRGTQSVEFIPSRTPYHDITIGCAVYADPPPNKEKNDETEEPKFNADWMKAHANRIRYWHEQDGKPNKNNFLRTFRMAIELIRVGTKEKVLVVEHGPEAGRGSIVIRGKSVDVSASVSVETKLNWVDRDPRDTTVWPPQNHFRWHARALTNGQDLKTIRGMVRFNPTLKATLGSGTSGRNMISARAYSSDNGGTIAFALKTAIDMIPKIPKPVGTIAKLITHKAIDKILVNEASCMAALTGTCFIEGVGIDHFDVIAKSDQPAEGSPAGHDSKPLSLYVTRNTHNNPGWVYLDAGQSTDGACALEPVALGQIEGGLTSEKIIASVQIIEGAPPRVTCAVDHVEFELPKKKEK